MPNTWYAIVDGKTVGPLSSSALKALAAEGKVTRNTSISASPSGERVMASLIKVSWFSVKWKRRLAG